MRRLLPLLACAGILAPGAALAASPSPSPAPLSAAEQRAVHVLISAPVFTDPAAEAGRIVAPNALRRAIGTAPVQIAVLPRSAAPAAVDASDVAEAVLRQTGRDDGVLFALLGHGIGAAAGARSGVTSSAARDIARQAFAAHQAGGFTPANVEASLEDAVAQAKGALAVAKSPQAVEQVDTGDGSDSKDPPAALVIGAVVVVVLVVVLVAVMSLLSRRSAHPHDAHAEPVSADTHAVPEDTGELPVVPVRVASAEPPPWTGGEWEQVVLTDG